MCQLLLTTVLNNKIDFRAACSSWICSKVALIQARHFQTHVLQLQNPLTAFYVAGCNTTVATQAIVDILPETYRVAVSHFMVSCAIGRVVHSYLSRPTILNLCPLRLCYIDILFLRDAT